LDEIPSHVRQFLEERIHSVAQIELLLLLKKDPARTWTAPDASRALAVPLEMAATHLAELQTAGLLSMVSASLAGYRYQPNTAELSQLVESLGQVY
jgi:hypothetical protein